MARIRGNESMWTTRSSVTDEELMVAYQKGDLTAFEVLYERNRAKVYGYLVAKLGEKASADDVFQGTGREVLGKSCEQSTVFLEPAHLGVDPSLEIGWTYL